jgi:probable F420-dependent oxidoreductase
MEIGLALPQYDFFSPEREPGRLPWAAVAATARRADDLGFHSLWLSDHLFLDRSRYGGVTGRCPGFDPLPALGALARCTHRARLGTLTLCSPLRPATVTAKQLATIDVLSGGRLVVGVGAGWSEDEFREVGVVFRRPAERLRHLEESIAVLRGMFGGGPFTFAGRYEQAVGAMCLPRPIHRSGQQAGPPIWVGGKGDRLLDLAARLADGWNTAWVVTPDAYRERLEVLDAACERAGRDPAEVARTVGLYSLVGEDEADLARRFERMRATSPEIVGSTSLDEWRPGRLVGTVAEVRSQLEGWAALGVSTVVVSPRPLPFSVPDDDDLEMLALACRL